VSDLIKIIIISLSILFSGKLLSQDIELNRFIRFFDNQSYAGKVNAFDTIRDELKLRVYPFVKNELQLIKDRAISDNQTGIINKLQRVEADLYYANKNYSKAVPIYLDLLAKSKLSNYKDSAKVFHNLKSSYVSLNSLNKAVEVHKQLSILKTKYPDLSDWIMMPNLSLLYYEMHLNKECLNQQLNEYELIKGDYGLLVNYYNNRGLYWIKAQNADSAISCFRLAKKYKLEQVKNKKNKSLDDEFVIGLIDGNIAQAYMNLKEFNKAIPLLLKDINTSKRVLNFQNAAISMFELSKCYLYLNNIDLSKKYLDSCHALMRNIDDVKTLLNINKQYALLYEKAGLYKISNDYYKIYQRLKDSTDDQNLKKDLIAFQINSQLAEKEKLIVQNQKKVIQRNNELSKQKNLRNILVLSGLVLITVIVFISFQLRTINYRKNLLQLKNKKIQTRNKIIGKALNEKDILIKEVYHRVKNNLQIISSLLRLQVSKSSNSEVINSLTEAQDRINSMALLHQLLYRNQEFASIKFNEYVIALINNIKSSFSNQDKTITITHRLEKLEIDLDTSIPLGLITNELISNAYKHAFLINNQGEIKVELLKQFKNRYCLKIWDNGVGLPKDFDVNKSSTLGLEIVSILSQQIHAELKYYNDSGACFEICFNAPIH
jgi:two-component sensor histidine kinase